MPKVRQAKLVMLNGARRMGLSTHGCDYQRNGRMRRTTDFVVVKEVNDVCPCTRQEIDRVHRRRGWLRIGYHFVITAEGEVQKGRDIEDAGAHSRGFNDCAIGIGLCGPGINELQSSSLLSLVTVLTMKYPGIEVINHPLYREKEEEFDAELWWKNTLSRIS